MLFDLDEFRVVFAVALPAGGRGVAVERMEAEQPARPAGSSAPGCTPAGATDQDLPVGRCPCAAQAPLGL